jgi:hypothetical protein
MDQIKLRIGGKLARATAGALPVIAITAGMGSLESAPSLAWRPGRQAERCGETLVTTVRAA